jgi:hypothetical protein
MTSAPEPAASTLEHAVRTIVTLPAGFSPDDLAEALEILELDARPQGWLGQRSVAIVHSAPR